VHFEKLKHGDDYRTVHYYVWQVIWAAAFILFGLVLFAAMPNFSQDAVKSAEHYGASAGLGVLVLFGVPIAACIACITVVGLFIGISTLFVWYAALYFAQIIVGTVVGQWLMGRTGELWPTVGRMAVGVVIVRVCASFLCLAVACRSRRPGLGRHGKIRKKKAFRRFMEHPTA